MTPRGIFVVSLAAGCALVSLGLMSADGDPAVTLRPAAGKPAWPQPADTRDAGAADDAVQAILARPLFDPARHAGAAAVTVDAAGIPRLAGTLVTPAVRLAIFAVNEADKPVAVPEGRMIGAWRVESIATGRVVLAGPDGRHAVRTTFSPGNTTQPQETSK